jgi:hypothetical protein
MMAIKHVHCRSGRAESGNGGDGAGGAAAAKLACDYLVLLSVCVVKLCRCGPRADWRCFSHKLVRHVQAAQSVAVAAAADDALCSRCCATVQHASFRFA